MLEYKFSRMCLVFSLPWLYLWLPSVVITYFLTKRTKGKISRIGKEKHRLRANLIYAIVFSK